MKSIIKGFLHVAIWFFLMFFTIYLMEDSEAKYAYGDIVAWWGALYCGYVLNIRISAATVPFAIHFLIGVLAVFLNWEWFYHDVPSELSIFYIIIILFSSLFFASPIFVNAAVRKIKDKLISKNTVISKFFEMN